MLIYANGRHCLACQSDVAALHRLLGSLTVHNKGWLCYSCHSLTVHNKG
jgi:hypothetical protein